MPRALLHKTRIPSSKIGNKAVPDQSTTCVNRISQLDKNTSGTRAQGFVKPGETLAKFARLLNSDSLIRHDNKNGLFLI